MNAVHTTISAATVPLSALLGSKMGVCLSTAAVISGIAVPPELEEAKANLISLLPQ